MTEKNTRQSLDPPLKGDGIGKYLTLGSVLAGEAFSGEEEGDPPTSETVNRPRSLTEEEKDGVRGDVNTLVDNSEDRQTFLLEQLNKFTYPGDMEDLRSLSGEMRSPFSALFNEDAGYLATKTLTFEELRDDRLSVFKKMFEKYINNKESIENKQEIIGWFQGLEEENQHTFIEIIIKVCCPRINVPRPVSMNTKDVVDVSTTKRSLPV